MKWWSRVSVAVLLLAATGQIWASGPQMLGLGCITPDGESSLIWSTLPEGVIALDAGDREAWEARVAELVNQERWNNGQLPPLKRHSALDASAYGHSQDMGVRNFFGHTNPDGLHSWDRAINAGYGSSYVGENIAAGYWSSEMVIGGWMGSSGHRANILNTSYRDMGVGYYYDANDDPIPGVGGPYYNYWTLDLGWNDSYYPVIINREAVSTTLAQVQLYLYGAEWGAQEMKIWNEGQSEPTAWQPFSTEIPSWTLVCGGGSKTVYIKIKNGSQVLGPFADIIELDALSVTPGSVTFLHSQYDGQTRPAVHMTSLYDPSGSASFSTAANKDWFTATVGPGQTSRQIDIMLTGSASSKSLGTYEGELAVTSNPAQLCNPATVTVKLIVAERVYDVYLPVVLRASGQ